jgi:hypothetical protein
MRGPRGSVCGTVIVLCALLVGCGDRFSGSAPAPDTSDEILSGTSGEVLVSPANARDRGAGEFQDRGTIWDIFGGRSDPNVTVAVNRYLWNASLDVLDFLPIQSVDPFSGIIVFGYGTPPGSGRAYRATVFVQDPALDARSLRVALASQSGPVPAETVRAIEDAILTRARQMRIAEERL